MRSPRPNPISSTSLPFRLDTKERRNSKLLQEAVLDCIRLVLSMPRNAISLPRSRVKASKKIIIRIFLLKVSHEIPFFHRRVLAFRHPPKFAFCGVLSYPQPTKSTAFRSPAFGGMPHGLFVQRSGSLTGVQYDRLKILSTQLFKPIIRNPA